MSINHQFPELASTIYWSYAKVCTSALGGYRMSPYKDGDRMEWVLQSSFSDFNIETSELTFNPKNDVLCVYSEKEKVWFEAYNARFFQTGQLINYSLSTDKVADTSMSDDDILDLAIIPTITEFRTKVNSIENATTLQRLKRTTEKIQRPNLFVKAVIRKLSELQG